MLRLQEAGIPAGLVQNGVDLVDRDPQLRHREWTAQRTHPVVGDHITDGLPVKLARTPAHRDAPGPQLGEANDYVYGELLGLAPEQITELMIDGAFG